MKEEKDSYCVTLTNEERASGKLESAKHQKALETFTNEGVVLLRNVFDKKFVSDLHEYYMMNYHDVSDSSVPSSYKIDHERYFIVPRLTSLFNDIRFYGNSIIIDLLHNILGSQWVYQSVTSVLSFPGSKAQAVHIDAPLLFNSETISPTLPVYALTVVLPLVDIDDYNGGTRVWPGSHHKPHMKDGQIDRPGIKQEDSVVMQGKRGDCFLMDYRLIHGGEPNVSDSPRPIVTFICTLPWFHDTINYEHIPEVIMTPSDIAHMPKSHHPRFNLPKDVSLYSNIGNRQVASPDACTSVDNSNISRNSPCYCGSGLRYKQCHGKA